MTDTQSLPAPRTLPDFTDPTVPLRALSWKQPFASLMLPPYHKVETRVWDTRYRGWVLICASQKPYTPVQVEQIAGDEQEVRIASVMWRDHERLMNMMHVCGYAIGIGYLSDVSPMTPEDADACYVKYHPDLYKHVYTDVYKIWPFKWKGHQGWCTVPDINRKLISIQEL